MKRIATISLLLLSIYSFNLNAQKQAGHWFFGHNVGLDFINTQTVNDDNGVPVTGMPTLENSPLYTNEGCFSVSDAKGNIIVFSDGMKVYNKNKQEIASGLNGHTSSAQSGIIIPYPENKGKYFIISNNMSAIYYSIFDSSGDGTVTNKNTAIPTSPYTTRTYENVTSIVHANKKDYWLLARAGSYFFAWLITKDGIPSQPTKAIVIPGTASNINSGSQGYMKLSPDGKKICHTYIDAPNGEVFFADFDNSTGEISNILLRNWEFGGTGSWQYRFYSLEFSPGGKNLFLSILNTPLYVIPTNDIETGTPTLVNGASVIGTVQTGPDGRLYGIQSSGNKTRTFGVIPNPDDDINDIKVHIFTNFLASGTGAIWGLPSFIASYFSLDIEGEGIVCMNASQTFNAITATNESSSIVPKYTIWDFGDGSAPTSLDDANVPGTQTKTHLYERPGQYTITVKVYDEEENEIPEMIQTFDVDVKACVLPVNPNIHTHKIN